MSEKPSLPNDFYKASTFFTLSGSAGAVWLFCLILHSFNVNSPLVLRVIALIMSLLIALLMLIREEHRKIENWFFAFFNGLLIFSNASGLNAISSGLTFENDDTVIKKEVSLNSNNYNRGELEKHKASFFSFLGRDTNWWIDNDYYEENEKLKDSFNKVTQEHYRYIKEMKDSLSVTSLINNKELTDSLRNEIERLKRNKHNSISENKIRVTHKNYDHKLQSCLTDLEELKRDNQRISNIKEKYLKNAIDQGNEVKRLKKSLKKKFEVNEDNPNVLLATIYELRRRLSECKDQWNNH